MELGIIIWRRTKYLFEGHDENEIDAKFFLRNIGNTIFPLEVIEARI